MIELIEPVRGVMPPCEAWPNLLFVGAFGVSLFLVVNAICGSYTPAEPWDWTKPRRRPHKRSPLAPLVHFIGAILTASAASYAISHPLCG